MMHDELTLEALEGRVTRARGAVQGQEIKTPKKSYPCPECNKNISTKEGLQGHIRQVHRGEKPFTCGICYKAFPQKASLRLHLNIHSGKEPYKCQHCGKTFRGKSNLNRHVRIHTQEKPYRCTYCEKTFSDPGNLKVHLNYHTQTKNFKCNVCGKLFYQRAQMRQHVKLHEKSEVSQSFECNVCGQLYDKEGYLRRHLKTHSVINSKNDRTEEGHSPLAGPHSSEKSTGISGPNLQESTSGKSLADEDICSELNGTEPGEKADLGKEKCENTKTQPRIGEKSNEGTEGNKSQSKEGKVKCLKCGKRLSSRASLTMHLKIHIGEKRHACNMCDKRFHQRTSLVVHQLIHKGEKPHACTTCDKAFASRANLVRHIRIHTKEKPYSCPHCDRKFGESGNLKVHLRFHTNTKPFKCDLCDKTFYQYAHLKQHQKTHNKDKIYDCKLCHRTFSRAGYLERHMRGHNRNKLKKIHKCSICSKELSRSTHLRRHMLVHRKEGSGSKKLASTTAGEPEKRPKVAEGNELPNSSTTAAVESATAESAHISGDDADSNSSLTLVPTNGVVQEQSNVNQSSLSVVPASQVVALPGPTVSRVPALQSLPSTFQEPYQVHPHPAFFNNLPPSQNVQSNSSLHPYTDFLSQRNNSNILPQRPVQSVPPQRFLSCETCGLQFSRPMQLKKHRKTHSNDIQPQLPSFHSIPTGGYDQELNTYSQFNHMPNLQQTYRCDVCNASAADMADLWAHFQIHSGQLRMLESKLASHSL